MAVEYKITVNSDKENRVQGFAYSVVPAGTNVASVTWKLALVEYLVDSKVFGTTSEAPSLPAVVSQTDLDAGNFYEWPFSVDLDAKDTPAAKEATVQAALVAEEAEILAVLQNRLRFWSREGTAS